MPSESLPNLEPENPIRRTFVRLSTHPCCIGTPVSFIDPSTPGALCGRQMAVKEEKNRDKPTGYTPTLNFEIGQRLFHCAQSFSILQEAAPMQLIRTGILGIAIPLSAKSKGSYKAKVFSVRCELGWKDWETSPFSFQFLSFPSAGHLFQMQRCLYSLVINPRRS